MTRTELIHSLSQNGTEDGEFITKAVRGNTLWTLWKGTDYFIVAYELRRDSDGWTYDRETEDSPPTSFTCPKKYLTRAPCINDDWRNKSTKYGNRNKNIKDHIRALYKSKERGQKLQVTLTAKAGYIIRLHDYALKDAILYIISVRPGIEGRFPQNGLRYSIPLRLVSDATLLTKENHHNDRFERQSTQSTDG